MEQNALTARIEQQLAKQADIHILVAQDEGGIVLSGRVGSEEERRIAEYIAGSVAPDRQIKNNLDVERFLPVGSAGSKPLPSDEANGEIPASVAEFRQEGHALEPGVSSQPLETDDLNVSHEDVVDEVEPDESEPAYFPPTDLVIGSTGRGSVDVLGGFAASSEDDGGVRRSAGDNQPGDEALADAIRQELSEDALTADLPIDVEVSEGVAHLYGVVPDLVDAENAEEVASRVPGVHEVIDELDTLQP